MRLLIRADSSSQIGAGHIMRDLVLAESLQASDVLFACRDLPGNINDRISQAGHKVSLLKSDAVSELASLVKHLNPDLLVIDHYGIGAKEEKRLKEQTGVRIMALDDTYRPHHCDILLNPGLGADARRYCGLVPQTCELRCGVRFVLLRSEFHGLRERRNRSGRIGNILVSMGGTDPRRYSLKVVSALLKCPGVRVDLVTTRGNRQLNRLRSFASTRRRLRLHIDTPEMAGLMQRADLAVVTPSGTLHEVLAMGLPFIAVQSADNQKEIAAFVRGHGLPVINRFGAGRLTSDLWRIKKWRYGLWKRRIKGLESDG